MTVRKSSILNAIGRYYNTLSHIGSVPKSDCYRILVSLFLLDLINSDLSFFVTEEDYDKIGRLYRSLVGGCILPYDGFCSQRGQLGSPLLHAEGMGVTRITEVEGDNRAVEFGDASRIVENSTWINNNGL